MIHDGLLERGGQICSSDIAGFLNESLLLLISFKIFVKIGFKLMLAETRDLPEETPQITNTGDSSCPFAVEGDTFADFRPPQRGVVITSITIVPRLQIVTQLMD